MLIRNILVLLARVEAHDNLIHERHEGLYPILHKVREVLDEQLLGFRDELGQLDLQMLTVDANPVDVDWTLDGGQFRFQSS